MGKDVITEAASTEADEASSGVVLQAEIDKSRRGKSNAISRGKGKKIGLTAEKHSAKTHTRENTNLNLSESGKKYPNIFEGSESGVAHKILSHLKQDEAALSGTSYAENHAMDDLIQSWNQRNPELDSLISERIGLDGIQDLTSIDQLRNNSWKNANASDSVKTEIMPKTALKDVPEIINNVLNSSNLVLPKRIEIPLKTPEGSIINLYLQEANGHIRAQISTNDRLVMESLHREVALLKDTPFENNIKWTPPQFERQESQKEQTGYRQPQQQSRQQTRQQDEETSKFEEAINFFDALRKEES